MITLEQVAKKHNITLNQARKLKSAMHIAGNKMLKNNFVTICKRICGMNGLIPKVLGPSERIFGQAGNNHRGFDYTKVAQTNRAPRDADPRPPNRIN